METSAQVTAVGCFTLHIHLALKYLQGFFLNICKLKSFNLSCIVTVFVSCLRVVCTVVKSKSKIN